MKHLLLVLAVLSVNSVIAQNDTTGPADAVLIFVNLGDEETYKIAGCCPADLGGAGQGAW